MNSCEWKAKVRRMESESEKVKALTMRLSELKTKDPAAYKILRKIINRGTDKNGNVSDDARTAARKAYRKLGYVR